MSSSNILLRRRNSDGHDGPLHAVDSEEQLLVPDEKERRSRFRRSRATKFVLVGLVVAIVLFWSPILGRGPKDSWKAVPAPDSNIRVNYTVDEVRRQAVVDAFKHAWSAYERDAMGSDEYHPIGRKGSNLSDAGGIGYAVIDAIDTMQVMGLKAEYQRARDWIAKDLTFERDGKHNLFETTIRVLGGLLSAYHLSEEDPVFLEKAVDLADRMLPAFDTPSGIPTPMVNLAKREGVPESYSPNLMSTAEASTLQLEFRYLSYLTDNEDYWYKAERVLKVIKNAKMDLGLAPIHIDIQSGAFMMSDVRLGSRGDSFYEYLLKQYLQTNRTEYVYQRMYEDKMDAIHKHLVRKGLNRGMTHTIELLPRRQPDYSITWEVYAKQDHLVCFLGGSLMLGAVRTHSLVNKVSVPPSPSELSEVGKRDWQTGYELIETCMDTYDSPTGLAPEIAHFYTPDDGRNKQENKGKDWYVKGMESPHYAPSYDARYMLRPETVESLFIAFRLTGDHRYRDYGWKIFQSIEKYCRVEGGGYTTILDVMNPNSAREDKMETFYLSETLKYLYLLFSDASVLPLDEYVFNTEAHPLPVFTLHLRPGFE